MPVYNYLPGVIVNTLDGGLVAPAAPQDDSILIIATAGQGPINTPFQVTDRSVSFNTFGAKGTLSRSVEECATYSDNITVFRYGATAMELTGVGADTTTGAATPGFSITFNGDVSVTRSLPARPQNSASRARAQDLQPRDQSLPSAAQKSPHARGRQEPPPQDPSITPAVISREPHPSLSAQP
jgi:hypothetical protein